MLNIVVYNIVVKAVELLTLPSHSKILYLVFLLATPLSLPEKKFKATDAIGLILWSFSVLITLGIIPESHFLHTATPVISWTCLILECLIENVNHHVVAFPVIDRLNISTHIVICNSGQRAKSIAADQNTLKPCPNQEFALKQLAQPP